MATRSSWRATLPGAGVAVVLAVLAWWTAPLLPLLGAPVLGVLLGLAVAIARTRRAATRPDPLAPGLKFASSRVLQIAIVLLGAQLSLAQVADTGAAALWVLLAVIAAGLAGAAVLGRALGVQRDLRTLIGVGTAICGGSAIAAATPVLRAAPARVAYALSTVFACNIAAVLLFPVAGELVGMSQETFGIFAGAAINDTSSVLAAAAAFGEEATDAAVVVKLTRTLGLIPVVVVLSVLVARREEADDGAGTRPGVWRLVPWFLVGFLVLAAVNSLGLIPQAAQQPLATVATFCITVALCAVGASTDLAGLRRTGPRPLVLGVVLWALVSLAALVTMAATGLLVLQ